MQWRGREGYKKGRRIEGGRVFKRKRAGKVGAFSLLKNKRS